MSRRLKLTDPRAGYAALVSLVTTEEQFQAEVIALAKLRGWRVYHTYDSRHSAAGYPDLTIVGYHRVIFVEVKTDTGKVTPEQLAWLAELSRCPGVETAVWRPRDWEKVESTLKGATSA